MAKGRDLGKQTWWLELVRRWQQSRLSVREFCQVHQVSQASFFSWRRVLRERGLLDNSKPSGATAGAPAFVKLTPLETESRVGSVELVLGSRWVLRVRPGFDADTLLQLVRLLEEPAC